MTDLASSRAMLTGTDDTLLGVKVVTVDNTANGKTLATLTVTIDPNVEYLTFVPATAGIYWAIGNASASTAWIPAGGIQIKCKAFQAATLKFYAATSIAMQVVQEG